MLKNTIKILSILLCLSSCGGGSDGNSYSSGYEGRGIHSSYDEEEDEEYEEEEGYEDGTHYATVNYYNPETGYSGTYNLEVEVEDNEVTVIYFNNSGYLDDDHISPEELDDYGSATIYGEEGKTYEVQID